MQQIHKILMRITSEVESAATMNRLRAHWADAAIKTFIDLTGCDREDALCDLLCGLMHLAANDTSLGSFEWGLNRAQDHFQHEVVSEQTGD